MRDFQHTVGVLVKAYFDNTLQHGNCAACAVGNVIADACGFKYEPRTGSSSIIGWAGKTTEDFMSWYTEDTEGNGMVVENSLTISTGYSASELTRIENAFESVEQEYDDRMFSGLMAVVDVLAEIHGIDLTEKESAKALFVKA